MSKKPIIGGIILVAILGMVAVGAQINPEYTEDDKGSDWVVWHARIAGPEFDNISQHHYSGIVLEPQVLYEFDFVPMGDSPDRLEIFVYGHDKRGSPIFNQIFVLEKTLVDTGISKYYTWDYAGRDRNFMIGGIQEYDNYGISVIRSGNLEGSVSISLSKVDTSI